MRNKSKRLLSWLLVLTMLVSILPTGVFAADETASSDTHYLMFATDRHTNTSVIGNIINNIESAIGENTIDYLGLGGDMVGSGESHPEYNSSTVLAEATGATSSLSAENVDIVAGIHDMNVNDDAGIVLPYTNGGAQIYKGDDYYIYGVEEYCIAEESDADNWSAQAQAFVDWANGDDIDKSKAIIVVSHYPLHAKRGDNTGAGYWHNALNTVATGSATGTEIERNVFFFHGHNHTVDSEEYCYAPGDTVSIESYVTPTSSTSVLGELVESEAVTETIYDSEYGVYVSYNGTNATIYYTYATAGYLNQNSKATLMTITDDTITLTKYGTSGGGTTMTSVERVAQEETVTEQTFYSKDTFAAVTATATDATLETYTEDSSADALLSFWYGYNISLTGQVEGTTATVTLWLPPESMTSENLGVYYLAEETNTYVEVTGYTVSTDESGVEYITISNAAMGTYIYGTPNTDDVIPEGATLDSLALSGPTKTYYFLSEDTENDTVYLDITGLTVKANYVLDGEIYSETIEWNGFDETVDGYALEFGDLTTPGEKTVTVSYGGKEATFEVWVCADAVTDETTRVEVTFDTECVTSVTIEPTTISADISGFVNDGYVAYDITPSYAGDYSALAGNATVTLPIPAGVTNPVVYYMDTDGTMDKMESTAADGYVTFTTDHFSVYLVGDEAEAEENSVEIITSVPDTTTKTVYVLTSSISSGSSYLIVNGNSAGSYYALANNSGSVAATSVTVKTDSTIGTYIELDDASDELWTVSGSSSTTLLNGDYYLRYDNGLGLSSRNSTTWSYSNNRLSCSVRDGRDEKNYYLTGGSSWSASTSQSNIYFYVPTEIEVDTTVETTVTYSVTGTDMEHIYPTTTSTDADGNTTTSFDLTKTATIAATTNATEGTWSYAVVSDTNGIIATGTDADGNTTYSISDDGEITFSGATGTAYVRVYYTFTVDGTEYTIWDTITVKATAPYYSIDLCDPVYTEATITEFESGVTYYTKSDDGTYTAVASGAEFDSNETYYTLSYESITEPIALKGIEAGDTYSVWAVVKEYTSANPDGVDMGTLGNALTWKVNDSSIATIDPETGVITFTGKDGTVQVTVYYTGADGIIYEDTITISVTQSLYVVPGDGTNDFPEYPYEGAVRFDKTATALGNFSETGIAQVELSMTGVPYTTGSAIDVLLMIDMSTSMDTDVGTDSDGNTVDRVAVTIAAAKAFAKTIVQNDDGTYNSNKIAIKYFNGSTVYTTTDYITVSSDTELEALNTLIDGLYTPTATGTYYSVAMESAYNTIIAQDAVSDNTQALVFMSDGGPTYYTYLNDSGTGTTVSSTDGSTFVGWFNVDDNDTTDDETDDTATPNSSFKTEYYSYLLKNAGYPVYTVGLGLSTNDTGPSGYTGLTSSAHEAITSYILSQMATSSSYFYNVADSDAVSNLGNIFSAIAASIKEAATNVVVEDKIGSDYSINFSLPSGVTSEDAGMSEFYIQVVDYVLDATTHERTGVYTVLENFTFNSDGTLKSHTVDGAACGDSCSHVTFTDAVVTKIEGTYFTYESTADGEFLKWTADKISSTELALQYFVYLDNSAGTDVEDQVDAGTYYTNEYATLTYTNYNGNECQQYFPVPQMTWKGAQVTYVFYLVNDAGQPVNRAGKIIPFAEAVYVTDPVTKSVTWNDETGTENMLAESLMASSNVPSVYALYDTDASYVIRVYQTENVDSNGVNGNYFQIGGSFDKLIDSEIDTDTTVDNSTTKVFNTKAGTKYDKYGVYSEYDVGTTLTDGAENITTTVKTTDIDYADTTVAFAVVWKPELVEDVVVVDYGLDVVIDVYTNDGLAAGVAAVMTAETAEEKFQVSSGDQATVVMNSGTYDTVVGSTSVTSTDGLWTASVENLTSVRFKQNEIGLNAPAIFYYEAGVNYYTYTNNTDSDGNTTTTATLNTKNMYSSVTVIPATTVYYEDEFVTYTDSSKAYDEKDDEGNVTASYGKWSTVGTATSATQDQDRPGVSKISADLDADNVYGYDSAYTGCAKYSMGAAKKVTVTMIETEQVTNDVSETVTTPVSGMASFDFYGTGFDVISMTDTTTGLIIVQVSDASGVVVKSLTVDTYYGYTRTQNDDGTYTWETTTSNDPNALYQVPVMTVEDLPYGKYTAKIVASYRPKFDHTETGSYDFYLDAIRIYDPTGVVSGATTNDTDNIVSNAYAEDDEAYPIYEELRNNVIDASEYAVTTVIDETTGEATVTVTDDDMDDLIKGAVFIDGNSGNYSIADYVSYGPNNELYLAPGQAIAFTLEDSFVNTDGTEYVVPVDVQLGIKTVGDSASVQIFNPATEHTTIVQENITDETTYVYDTTAYTKNNLIAKTVSTATDMYYSIAKVKDGTIVVYNPSTNTNIISLTNIKYTFDEAAKIGTVTTEGDTTQATALYITEEAAAMTLNVLNNYSNTVTTTEVWDQPFSDVTDDDWYVKELKYLHYKDIINGMGDETIFAPKAETTRAMIVKTLWMIETGGVEWNAKHSFVDVEADSWYDDAVAWAYDKGIVKGTTEITFEPNKTITRAEIVTMLYRYAELKGLDISVAEEIDSFADSEDVASWCDAEMQWAYANGIINGIPEDDDLYLKPQGTTTREQMVAFLYRIIDYVK